jgi:hypothetical protein
VLPTHKPHEETFLHPSNCRSSDEILPSTWNTISSPVHVDTLDSIRVPQWSLPTPSFDSVPVQSSPTNMEWAFSPYSNTDWVRCLHSGSRPTLPRELSPRFESFLKAKSSLTDIYFSLVQNWSTFEIQSPLPPSNMQHFFNTTPQSSLTPTLVDNGSHPSPTTPPTRAERPNRMIGNIYRQDDSDEYIFMCHSPSCNHKTFTRWYDLRRHHDGTHSNEGPTFWCQVNGCECSNVEGGRAFPRKDKLNDHVRKMHRSRNLEKVVYV